MRGFMAEETANTQSKEVKVPQKKKNKKIGRAHV